VNDVLAGLRARLTRDSLAAALLRDPASCVALLDRQGTILRYGGGWIPALSPGTDAAAALAEPAASRLRRALATGEDLVAAGRLAGTPVSISLTACRDGKTAAILRLTDTTRLHDLEEALGQAQRLQEVGELAGGIAHDFNNLLTAILGAADDLAARASAPDLPDLDQIRASARRGAALVRQLLAFSQRQTLQPRVLALDEAVEKAGNLLRRLLGNQVRLVLALNAPGRAIHMDETQLDQVLMNLAVNARNAMPDGGTITIRTDRRLVLKSEETGTGTIPPGRYATIDITDTGGGIPADILPRIFDPFFTTRRESGGTGLGLSMVQGIIRQSGGYLSVRSAPGAGTCFTITLPRHETEQLEPKAPPPPPRHAASGSRRVLLVDDDDAIRRLAKRALTRAACDVMDADGADAALQADPAKVDCVVSDVSMPGMDGPTLVRRLRQFRPGLPAILISGYADAGQRQALAAEDIAFLSKPFSMTDLTQAVDRVLAQVPAPVD
jgi:two-component system, cell cycle sensor histidine kinase and response regulator CckA